jgi:DNA-binding MarR family transcriptional regulator
VVSSERPIGLVIVAARQALRHAIYSRARRFRLTGQQFWAVVVLRERPGMTRGDLAETLLLDPPAASRLVALLARRKLVEVRPDREDRRRFRVFLTPAGEVTGARIAPIAEEFQTAIVAGMNAEEVARLRAGLHRVVAHLDRFEGAERKTAGPSRTS